MFYKDFLGLKCHKLQRISPKKKEETKIYFSQCVTKDTFEEIEKYYYRRYENFTHMQSPNQ